MKQQPRVDRQSPEQASGSRPTRASRQKLAADDTAAATLLRPKSGLTSQTLASLQPTILLLSDDSEIAELVAEAARPLWKVEYRRGAAEDRGLLALANVQIVVLDDAAVDADRRAVLMNEIRRHASAADLVYIAARHSAAHEKRARAGGAQYYTAKPVNRPQFVAILKSFMRAHA